MKHLNPRQEIEMSGHVPFTVEEEAELISLVQERRLIWDVKHRHYHQRDLKEVAYSEVAAALGGRIHSHAGALTLFELAHAVYLREAENPDAVRNEL